MAVLRWAVILHYLDDFFAILPPLANYTLYEQDFDGLCSDLGLKVNVKKNVCGTLVDFLGIELDSSLMEARLPPKKLDMAVQAVKTALAQTSILRTELQSLVGFLSFAAKVVIPGRSFLRRLYDALRNTAYRHRITTAMRLDLQWWSRFLPS